ncbi:hypothetical protein [Leptospira kanakyensis]|uniref:Lipoprotein n=1 Tax=Leptospira kanakyensis TaxID=2484968 RepID=A0A6N4Q8K9_9LEPT|nr:hypothetical protein [Leptospira kanakyensis]MCW7471483.1 hypothetical protein [Leptospira kanakyensis]MCW7482214.1 hypothetical protein [Leptospira kanakyensis]TGK52001.1 hypothetical protein EHQ11_07870 [Leptospira kanakyensis]TGK57091.1 hypothetical protein EHQ16_14505 [Leptospira kanakyensis]TGK71893.1 hypothetical protein EHQ18_07970 [Leptospira kanakyensis]
MKETLILLFTVSFFLSCTAAEVEDPSFIGRDKGKYISAKEGESKSLLGEILGKQTDFQSFKSEFSMQIQTFVPKKDNVSLDGKLYFSKESKQIKIQLMDTFFGMVFTEVIANPNQIQIKPTSTNEIQTLPMGDILIQDPNTKKKFAIPFPVIYEYLTGTYVNEIQNPKAKFNTADSRIALTKPDGEYEYFFKEGNLDRLELSSIKRGLKAIALVKTKPEQIHPPKEILTKVISLDTEKENVLIQIKLKKSQMTEPPANTFRF